MTLTFLVNSGETNEAQAKALVDAFTAANPTITIQTSLRPGGGDGDNLVKTKLATGEMEDLFHYNSGSLLQALTPDKTLVNVADQEWVSKLDPNFKTAVGTANGTYGAPWNTSMAGGVLYNKDIYAELGLKVPTTWDEFIANSQKIKDAGQGGADHPDVRRHLDLADVDPRGLLQRPGTEAGLGAAVHREQGPLLRSAGLPGLLPISSRLRSPGCSTRTSRPPPMTTPSRCLRPGPGPSTRC